MFQVETLHGSTILHVRGDVDFPARDRFSSAVQLAAQTGAERFIVSLAECPYFDCSGIGALVAARKILGERLKVVVPQKNLTYRMFGILGLIEHLGVVPTLDEALAQPTVAA